MTSLLGRTDGWTDGQMEGRSDPTPRPASAVGDAGKNMSILKTRVKFKRSVCELPFLHNPSMFPLRSKNIKLLIIIIVDFFF